jgi:ribosomal protein S18 acetylase RimI-like enzyme
MNLPIKDNITFAAWIEGYGSYEDDHIVFTQNGVEYVVDSKDRPRYFTAFKLIKNKPLKVGTLSLQAGQKYDGKEYLRINSVDVDKKHRRERIAHTLYLAALKALKKTGYGGLLSRDEDVAAKKFVKSIRQRLGAYNPDPDNPGLWIIDAR